MSEPLLIAIIASVSATVGSIITIVIAKIFSKRQDDASLVQQYQDIASKAVEDLRQAQLTSAERDKKRTEEYTKVQERLKLVEAATYGPFRITLDFTTHPLGIQNQKIELIVVRDDKEKTK